MLPFVGHLRDKDVQIMSPQNKDAEMVELKYKKWLLLNESITLWMLFSEVKGSTNQGLKMEWLLNGFNHEMPEYNERPHKS